MLVNTVYAFLAAEADATDRVAVPTYLAAGADAENVSTKRGELDDWLAEPMGREAQNEAALLSYLKGA